MEKKRVRLVQTWLCIAILHMDMQNGYKKKTLIFDCERFKMGEKNKRLLNLYLSLKDFLTHSCEISHTLTKLLLAEKPTSLFTGHRQQCPGLPAQPYQNGHRQKNFTGLPHGAHCSLTGTVWSESTTIHVLSAAAEQKAICCPLLTSAGTLSYIYM